MCTGCFLQMRKDDGCTIAQVATQPLNWEVREMMRNRFHARVQHRHFIQGYDKVKLDPDNRNNDNAAVSRRHEYDTLCYCEKCLATRVFRWTNLNGTHAQTIAFCEAYLVYRKEHSNRTGCWSASAQYKWCERPIWDRSKPGSVRSRCLPQLNCPDYNEPRFYDDEVKVDCESNCDDDEVSSSDDPTIASSAAHSKLETTIGDNHTKYSEHKSTAGLDQLDDETMSLCPSFSFDFAILVTTDHEDEDFEACVLAS